MADKTNFDILKNTSKRKETEKEGREGGLNLKYSEPAVPSDMFDFSSLKKEDVSGWTSTAIRVDTLNKYKKLARRNDIKPSTLINHVLETFLKTQNPE